VQSNAIWMTDFMSHRVANHYRWFPRVSCDYRQVHATWTQHGGGCAADQIVGESGLGNGCCCNWKRPGGA